MSETVSGPRPSDKWIPWYFVFFFVALAFVLVPMCVVAFRTYTGVVTDDAYQKGLDYNKDIAAARRQQALGWSDGWALTPAGDGRMQADFALRDARGALIRDAAVQLWFVRPTQASMDRKMQMRLLPDGHYGAQIDLPAHGLWEVSVSATEKNNNYQVTKRVVLP